MIVMVFKRTVLSNNLQDVVQKTAFAKLFLIRYL